MKKILLVDDDSFFRTMFASMLPWGGCGFSLLQAGNGRDAIDILNRNRDIVLVFTDMDMPILDGVALIRYISKHCPGLRCIALSAYDDFSYVRPSLKSGADDYLLKHTLTKAQLLQVLEAYAAMPQKAEPARSDDGALRARFLFDFITGAYRSVAEMNSLLSTLSLPSMTGDLLLMILAGDTPQGTLPFRGGEKAAQRQRDAACCMLQAQLDRIGSGVVFFGQDGLLYLLVTADGFSSLMLVKQVTQVLQEQSQRMMSQYFNLSTRLLCAPLCRNSAFIHHSYQMLMQQLNREPADGAFVRETRIQLPGEDMLLDELCYGTQESLRQMVAAVYREGRVQYLSQSRFSELTVDFLQRAAKAAARIESLECPAPANPEGSDKEQEAHVFHVLRHLQIQAAEAMVARYSPVVLRALRLIHSRICDETLSPSSVSGQLRVNPAYLSRLFKSQAGQNISDYISQKRLNRACSLLDSGTYSVKEVAAMSGYENYNYFFKVFKKHMGITPGEYRIRAITEQEA